MIVSKPPELNEDGLLDGHPSLYQGGDPNATAVSFIQKAVAELPKPMRGHTAPLVYYDDHEYSVDYSSSPDVTCLTTVFPDGSQLHTVTNDPVGMLPGTLEDKFLSTPRIFVEWSKLLDRDQLKKIMAQTLGLCEAIVRTESNYRHCSMKVNYGRIPSKRAGRKGTRRDWKRKHAPRTISLEWTPPFPPRFINHTVTISRKGLDHGMG
jgi:hypothetical protein